MAEGEVRPPHRALVDQAKQAPGRVLAESRALLAGAPQPVAVLHWAEAVALFELGRNDEAIAAFGLAIDAARRQSDAESFVWRIDISLAAAEAAEGRVDDALARLRSVGDHRDPLRRALAESQAALLYLHSGAPAYALELLEQSLPALKGRATESAATARVLMNIGYCRLILADLDGADDAHHQAAALGDSCDERLVSAGARQNLGYVASLRGDHQTALDHFADARQTYASMGEPPRRNLATFFDDLAEAYRCAGLLSEALRYARLAVWTTRTGGNLEKRADAEYRRARCLLDMNHGAAAASAARRAHALYASAGRRAMAARAEMLLLDVEAGDVDGSTALTDVLARGADVDRLASVVAGFGWHTDAREFRLRHGDRCWVAGAHDAALQQFTQASTIPAGATLEGRLGSLYGRAAAATLSGNDAAEFIDVARTMIATHRVQLADPELARSGARLVDRFRICELLLTLDTADPAAVLRCEEAWRSLDSGGHHAMENSAAMTSLRALHRLDAGDRPESFDREVAALEREVLDQALRHRPSDLASEVAGAATFDLDASVARLSGSIFVEWVETTNDVYRVTVSADGELQLDRCGRRRDIRQQVMSLRRRHVALVQTAPHDDVSGADQRNEIRRQGAELAAVLFGEVLVSLVGEGVNGKVGGAGLVLAPPASMAGIPWAMLLFAGPGTGMESVTVTSSLGAWLSERNPGPGTRAVMLAGPRLVHSRRDAVAFGATFSAAEVLEGDAATCGAAVAAFLDAEVLHVAAHGHLRNDNARFSSVELSDGHLWLHEVDAAPHAPELVVLAVCDAARMISEQRGQGAVDTLLQRGAGTVIAPTMAVPDDELATVFEHFYRHLPSAGPAAALASAQRELSAGEPRLWAVAHSLLCAGRAPRPAPIRPAT